MREIPFSIPVSGVIRIDGDSITIAITVNKVETSVTIDQFLDTERHRGILPRGQRLFDVILDAAQRFVGSDCTKRFSAFDLYQEAQQMYPALKRRTWTLHCIASAPNHPSYKHARIQRDYFRYVALGTYTLSPKYLVTEDKRNEKTP